MRCPNCRAEVVPGDDSIVLCLECATPLRIVDGRAEETDPGAVRAPVENDPTDRADAPPVTELPANWIGPTQPTSHEPPPLPPPPAAEPNAPSAPVPAHDDRTPVVAVAAAPRSLPTPTAPIAPQEPAPSPRRGISIVVVVMVALALIAIVLLR
jgi:hypothetical protein